MPSQDNDLDELLKGMSLEEETDRPGNQDADALDIDAVSGMTEEEIAGLLAAGAGESGSISERGNKEESKEEIPALQESGADGSDVLDMLEGTKDHELKEIQDMLEKSDRNESIGGGGQEQAAGTEESPVDRLLADIEEAGENEVAMNVADGKDRRVSKKEARRQEKAAKKEVKKLAKQAAKENKVKKRGAGKSGAEGEPKPASQKAEPAGVQEYDIMMDKNLLDSIVSGAGQAGRQNGERTSSTESTSSLEGTSSGEKGAAPERGSSGEGKETKQAVGEAGGIGDLLSYAKADLDSAQSSEADWTENEDGAPELDIMTLDVAEADALIAERPPKDEKGAKAGLFSKMVSFLMEEEEEEPEAENEDVQLSEENEEILKDLDNEKPKKGGKAKKAKKKKPAKKEKKAKPKKPPKPKKEKKPKAVEEYPLGKRITLKKALPLIIFGISLGAAIFIVVNLSTDYKDKQEAKSAYNRGDYEACYRNLFGKELNDTEAAMYGRSESILYIRRWYREYEIYAERGAEVQALDSLIQTVTAYPELYAYAAQWNAGMDVYEIYLDILDVLYNKYGITETQALEIAAVKSDLEYTRIVTALAEGGNYSTWNQAPVPDQVPEPDQIPEPDPDPAEDEGTDGSPEALPDELPEESGIDGGDFIENQ